MSSISQQELVKLGQQAITDKQYPQAESYFTTAIELNSDLEIEQLLVETLILEQKFQSAFEIAATWQNVLQNDHELDLLIQTINENHLNIERLKLIKKANVKNIKIDYKKFLEFKNLSEDQQKKIYQDLTNKFSQELPLNRQDLFKMQKLDEVKYLQLIKAALVNPYLSSNNRTILIEELNDFKYEDELTIIFQDTLTTIVPAEVGYFFNDAIISQGLALIEERYEKDPTFLQLMKMSFLQIMQEIFPFTSNFIDDLTSFLDQLEDYLKNGSFSDDSPEWSKIQTLISENLN